MFRSLQGQVKIVKMSYQETPAVDAVDKADIEENRFRAVPVGSCQAIPRRNSPILYYTIEFFILQFVYSPKLRDVSRRSKGVWSLGPA